MKLFTPSLLALAVASASTVTLADEALPVVSVTADFRAATVFDIGSSLSIIDAQSITQRNAEHLEEVLNLAPNVNISSGASRARFFQIRGIGERSKFEKISNPSVGVLIDDVDFTGIGNAGTLLDVEQVEVLRGPQGTRYGANALAGLINIKTKAPTETYEGSVKTTVADYGSYNISGVVSGPINDDVQYRLAAQKNISDGYIENDYLARKDTNNIDEETLRGKLRWKSSDELTFDFTALYVNIDNGYDVAGMIGQWEHNYPDQWTKHNNQDSGYGGEAIHNMTRWDWAQDLFEWFEYYLKGIGPAPDLHAQVQRNDGEWRIEETWPPLDVERMALDMSECSNDGAFLGGGAPVVGGGQIVTVECPAMSDTDLHIAGLATLHLQAVPTFDGGQVFIEMQDAETGLRLGHATMDIRYYAGGYDAQTVVPGQVLTMMMEFQAIDAILPAGHGLRFIMSDQGEDYLAPACGPSCTVHVLPSSSTLELPIIDRDGSTVLITPQDSQ